MVEWTFPSTGLGSVFGKGGATTVVSAPRMQNQNRAGGRGINRS